jgi:hypothetical protein
MPELSDNECNLLRYYAETEHILHGNERGAVHQHPPSNGHIEERTFDTRDALVVVTATGQKNCANGHRGGR